MATKKLTEKKVLILKKKKSLKKVRIQKRKKLKKIFLTVLHLYNLLLTTQLYLLQIQMVMLFHGHLLDKKVLKVPENLHLMLHK